MKLLGPGGVDIAGHHVSYGLLAVLLAVPVAALAIHQFRQGGGISLGGVSTGTADTSGGTGADTGAVAGTDSTNAALASLSSSYGSLASYLAGTTPYSAPAMAAIPAAPDISALFAPTTRAVDLSPTPVYGAPPSPPPPHVDAALPASIYSPSQTLASIIAAAQKAYVPPAPVQIYSPSLTLASIVAAAQKAYVPPAPAPAPAPAYTVTPVGSGPGGHGLIL